MPNNLFVIYFYASHLNNESLFLILAITIFESIKLINGTGLSHQKAHLY